MGASMQSLSSFFGCLLSTASVTDSILNKVKIEGEESSKEDNSHLVKNMYLKVVFCKGEKERALLATFLFIFIIIIFLT